MSELLDGTSVAEPGPSRPPVDVHTATLEEMKQWCMFGDYAGELYTHLRDTGKLQGTLRQVVDALTGVETSFSQRRTYVRCFEEALEALRRASDRSLDPRVAQSALEFYLQRCGIVHGESRPARQTANARTVARAYDTASKRLEKSTLTTRMAADKDQMKEIISFCKDLAVVRERGSWTWRAPLEHKTPTPSPPASRSSDDIFEADPGSPTNEQSAEESSKGSPSKRKASGPIASVGRPDKIPRPSLQWNRDTPATFANSLQARLEQLSSSKDPQRLSELYDKIAAAVEESERRR